MLGLGGGGIVRDLAADSEVAAVDVVDWSYELPRLLRTPRARAALDDVMEHPKVKVIRTDARVAAGAYGDGTFDVVLHNLTYTAWVGATSIHSARYVRELARILTPAGVLVFESNYSAPDDRAPVLASIGSAFSQLLEHTSASCSRPGHPSRWTRRGCGPS